MNLQRCTHLDQPRLVDLDTGLVYGLGPRNRPFVTSAAAIGAAVHWLNAAPAVESVDELADWLRMVTA